MIAYLWVALGSALGGMARYGGSLLAARLWGEAFPWGTIAINILGSFVIGFFGTLTVTGGAWPASVSLRTFVMVGICGGFTTFSSFSLQTLSLARDGNLFGALGNVVLSVVLCLLAVTAGQLSAARVGARSADAAVTPITIVAVLDRIDTAQSVLAASALAAIRLRTIHPATDQPGPVRIEVLHIRHNAEADFMPTEDVLTETRRQSRNGQAVRLSSALFGTFNSWRQGGGVGTWREATGETARIIMQAAANANLIVIGRPTEREAGMRSASHAALFDSERPTLLVPDAVPSAMGRHIAVAWKPSAAVERVINAALPLLLQAEHVSVLVGREEDTDEPEPATLLQQLAAAKVAANVRRFQGSSRMIGDLLLAQAHLAGADLLVMGAYTRNRFVETALGGATRDILAKADLPVLLHH